VMQCAQPGAKVLGPDIEEKKDTQNKLVDQLVDPEVAEFTNW